MKRSWIQKSPRGQINITFGVEYHITFIFLTYYSNLKGNISFSPGLDGWLGWRLLLRLTSLRVLKLWTDGLTSCLSGWLTTRLIVWLNRWRLQFRCRELTLIFDRFIFIFVLLLRNRSQPWLLTLCLIDLIETEHDLFLETGFEIFYWVEHRSNFLTDELVECCHHLDG